MNSLDQGLFKNALFVIFRAILVCCDLRAESLTLIVSYTSLVSEVYDLYKILVIFCENVSQLTMYEKYHCQTEGSLIKASGFHKSAQRAHKA